MKFLIDAQLPRRLAHQLSVAGYETTHTLDLPQGDCGFDSRPRHPENTMFLTRLSR
jgi:predicted nuclease of predicted toxin-antitoxin system